MTQILIAPDPTREARQTVGHETSRPAARSQFPRQGEPNIGWLFRGTGKSGSIGLSMGPINWPGNWVPARSPVLTF